jgi:molecular chaperone HscC
LSKLTIHPRERIEFRTLSARAERLYQELRGAPREALALHILAFERALESQDSRLLRGAAKDFDALLDQVEHQARFLDLGACAEHA